MTIHARNIRGALAYYETHRKRLVDAVGGNVIKYIAEPSHFQANAGTAADPSRFTTTVTEVGTGTSEAQASNAAGATFELVTAANDNDGISLQLMGESFELTSDQDLYFGCAVKANDIVNSDFFLGLAITDTDILGGVTDRVGFQTIDTETDLDFMVEKDTTETKVDSGATLANDTYVTIEFYWDGATLACFLDGAEFTAPALTNLPNNEALRLSLEYLTGEATANTLTFQFLRIIQIGR